MRDEDQLDDPAFNEMVDACIEAGVLVDAAGTPGMQSTMRVFLYLLGREVARRQLMREGGNGAVNGG